MRIRVAIGIFMVCALIVGGVVLFLKNNEPEPIANFEPVNCLYSDTISGETAVPNWKIDTSVESRTIDREKFNVYEPLQDLTLDDQPLAWENATGKVVIDNEIFSPLQFVDVTKFSDDTMPIVIGQITETDLKDEEWRTVLKFLLKSHVIKTYVHLESELCLNQETNSDTEYSAHFTAVHRYCTNHCYEDPYEFTVSIDKQTANITVQ